MCVRESLCVCECCLRIYLIEKRGKVRKREKGRVGGIEEEKGRERERGAESEKKRERKGERCSSQF